MKPAAVDWPIVAGDDETMAVTFQGLGYVAGRTWRAQVRASRSVTSELLAEVSVMPGDDAGTQVVTLSLDAVQTRALEKRSAARWDLQMTDSGRVTTVLAGAVTVVRDVTE